jgi:hypothetical protein
MRFILHNIVCDFFDKYALRASVTKSTVMVDVLPLCGKRA